MMKIGGVDGHKLYGRQTMRGNLAYGGGPHEWIDVEEGGPVDRRQELLVFVLRPCEYLPIRPLAEPSHSERNFLTLYSQKIGSSELHI